MRMMNLHKNRFNPYNNIFYISIQKLPHENFTEEGKLMVDRVAYETAMNKPVKLNPAKQRLIHDTILDDTHENNNEINSDGNRVDDHDVTKVNDEDRGDKELDENEKNGEVHHSTVALNDDDDDGDDNTANVDKEHVTNTANEDIRPSKRKHKTHEQRSKIARTSKVVTEVKMGGAHAYKCIHA
jgi:hypothetical protein